MIFLHYSEVEPNKARVLATINMSDKLPAEDLSTGLCVELLPHPEPGQGTPVLYVNPETKALWYEYLPAPEEPMYAATAVGSLQRQVDDLKLIIAQILAGA